MSNRHAANRWRWVVVAIATLILCSCRSGPQGGGLQAPGSPDGFVQRDIRYGDQTMPASEPGTEVHRSPGDFVDDVEAVSYQEPCLTSECAGGQSYGPPPLPYTVHGPWTPPGISGPWPADEYLRDGGDFPPPARLTRDRQLEGLEMEGTVAHYESLDGSVCMQPSNEVYLYSPRFAAVRSVVGVNLNEQVAGPVPLAAPLAHVRLDDVERAWTGLQNLQPEGQLGTKKASGYRMRQGDGVISTVLLPRGFSDTFMAFEDLTVIRRGVLEQADKPRLSASVDAAIVWAHELGVQVILDEVVASEISGDKQVGVVYSVDETPGCPKLCVVKVASTPFAEPGDLVDFTIRFDNMGPKTIGNATIVDNLSTRLEYVPNTAQSSVEAGFSTEENESGSLILRWEITNPIRAGEGGIVRFQCRVR